MITIVGIILTDLILVVLFICYYRQELGLTVNGSGDAPVLHKRPTGR